MSPCRRLTRLPILLPDERGDRRLGREASTTLYLRHRLLSAPRVVGAMLRLEVEEPYAVSLRLRL